MHNEAEVRGWTSCLKVKVREREREGGGENKKIAKLTKKKQTCLTEQTNQAEPYEAYTWTFRSLGAQMPVKTHCLNKRHKSLSLFKHRTFMISLSLL
jgi:hypothetical protein